MIRAAAPVSPSRRHVRCEWIAEPGSVGMARRLGRGRLPPHVEYPEWPTAVVEGRSADDYEAEHLVEAARRGVLLVDVDRQLAAA